MDKNYIGNLDDYESFLERLKSNQIPEQSNVKFYYAANEIPIGNNNTKNFIVPEEYDLIFYGLTISQANPSTNMNFNIKENYKYYFDNMFNTRHGFLSAAGSHYSSQKLVKFAMPIILKRLKTITIEMFNDGTAASPELDIQFSCVRVYNREDIPVVMRKIEVLNV